MNSTILLAENLFKTVSNDDIFEKKYTKILWKKEKLEVNSPGFFVIAGKNGSGKSTLIRCLLGLIKPTSGSIKWFNNNIINASLIGYLPEFPVIPPAAKVKYWLSWLLDKKTKELNQMDTELTKFPTLSIKHLLEVPANRLSKGQQQRVQLWAALATNPKVVVLDEPFSGLDPWAKVELAELISAIMQTGTCVFMSTHELPTTLRDKTTQTWLIENETIVECSGCALPH